MLMLYAKTIESANWDYRKSFERLTVKKENITDVNFEERASDEQNGIISVKEGRFGYFIRLKENKNFSTVMEFFEYIRDYSEICFETKEIPTKKKEPKIGDIYRKNEKYLLILGLDIYYVYGICKRGIITEFLTPSKDDVIKYWKYVGNKENAAYNINIAFKSFNDFVDEKEK